MTIDRTAFEETRRNAVRRLLAERNERGHWTGYLSSSALSTATAMTALAMVDRGARREDYRGLILGGGRWLIANQNEDGGWGDTDKSVSNISTTMLCWSALGLTECGSVEGRDAAVRRGTRWLSRHAGGTSPAQLTAAVMKRYGEDRTFSVPILTMSALCGRLGAGRAAWRAVRQLPFELAALPRRWFGRLNLRVVSYALPALIAIGQVRHRFRPTRNPITRVLRMATRRRTLRLLGEIQPTNGGFLEATPLTSFVTMSLAACGLAKDPITQRSARFLAHSARADGSWPIDTNLATWVTTLSVNALASGSRLSEYVNADERRAIVDWLLGQQYTKVHPYTDAAPGGWAWTDLPGGVPDADDTSGAVVALGNLCGVEHEPSAGAGGASRAADAPAHADATVQEAVADGLRWLRSLQNRDGGIPTFCRGWGKLPFDRSSTDITGHYLSACHQWHGEYLVPNVDEWQMNGPSHVRALARQKAEQGIDVRGFRRAVQFLSDHRLAGGVWAPMWFGNQYRADEANPTYGTSRVLMVLARIKAPYGPDINDSVRWLVDAQNKDGGWGGADGTPASVEETALAVEALAAVAMMGDEKRARPYGPPLNQAIERGAVWLIQHTKRGTEFDPSPIGFYFAKLWYYEKLYPIIFTVGALERVRVLLDERQKTSAAGHPGYPTR